MPDQQQRLFTFLVFSSVLVVFAGCGRAPTESEIKANVANFDQKLILTINESETELKLEQLDIFLVDDDEAMESFQLRGSNVLLAGTFPKEIRVGYDEEWSTLVDEEIPISAKVVFGSDETESTVILPGLGKVPVTGGSITIDRHDPGFDAKTPLTGKVRLIIKSPKGEQTIEGTLSVLAKTWG